MNQRIFDQLDMLERGARLETHPSRDAYNNSSAEFSGYDGPEPDYVETREYQQHAEDEYADQPMVLDSFDEQLLRQPDHNSRYGQATLGRARLSIPPRAHQHEVEYERSLPYTQGNPPQGPRLDLSRFALDPTHHVPTSLSPRNDAIPSSPAFNASQRRPAYAEHASHSRSYDHQRFDGDLEQASTYQPVSVEQLEAEERHVRRSIPPPREDFRPDYQDSQPNTVSKSSGAPIVQGIQLVSTRALPDRFRSMFSFPLFNAVQSKCFDTIYKTNDNFVLSAPTGSGKTAVLELAICRLAHGFANGSYKIVYQAPTKSLCSERQRDWQAKFAPLDLQCAELTGDTDHAQLRNVQHASIIITTPEKWDSMTRKWKDHQKLMQMVKLFLIDEVHILKEDRGATLEAVVSRMKSVGSDVRFVALSATVPNSQDIAVWLGKDPINTHLPATRERFGEEFRPVRLQKHVCGYQAGGNDFQFEKVLNGKLPEVITKYSQRKPIMVFCFTRSSCVDTAKLLASWWATKGPRERYWSSPRNRITVGEKDLQDTISSGVAFHHAGLQIQDRTTVEKAYLAGEINVICCTSTLAVGVNLPCHMVIIKNTVTYQSNGQSGCKEYSDLEIMQMLGRAGRPQFDDSAVAVIMTRQQRVQYYEKMITGQEVLESCLHRNLIDHLNAEIGLGTISGPSSAKKWLSGTFLYVRLKENPEHYQIEGDVPGRNLEERLENICSKAITLLEEHDLVQATPKLYSTEFGDAMARYYLQFETMKIFLAIPPKAKVSEILSAISQAAEFKDIRFRAGEKPVYKDLNKNGSIKFPIPVNLDAPAHKVSLVIQSVLGAVEFDTADYKHRLEHTTAKSIVFQHISRLVRCIIDCQLYLDDAVTIRNALMLARSFGAQVWDDSPLHMKQLDQVGVVAVRKLAAAGIKSIEDIEMSEAHRLEQVLSRNPPYGAQLLEKARAFPKLRVSVKMMGEPVVKKGEHVTVKMKAEIGLLNDKLPETFQRKAVYVCLLAETSDGHKIHFARISAKKLNKGQDVLFSANLTSSNQSIRAYVMCDEIAGTMRHANLKPEIPPIAFPPPKTAEETNSHRALNAHAPNTSKRRASASRKRSAADDASDEFGDGGLDDADFARAEAGDFVDIDDFDDKGKASGESKQKQKKRKTATTAASNEDWEPQQLVNGKWACNHTCKDKTACKHYCCREGLDKKPKPPKAQANKKEAEPVVDPKQSKLNMAVGKKSSLPTPAASSAGKAPASAARRTDDSREARDLNRLHDSIKTTTRHVPNLSQATRDREQGLSPGKKGPPRLSFLEAARDVEDDDDPTDYGMDSWSSNDLPGTDDVVNDHTASRMSPPKGTQAAFHADEEMLDETHGDADHSQQDQPLSGRDGAGQVDFSSFADDFNFELKDPWTVNDDFSERLPANLANARSMDTRPTNKDQHLFAGYSTDSAAQDLGLYDTNTIPQHHATHKQPPTSSKFFHQPPNTTSAPSAKIQEEAAKFERALPADDFLASVAEAAAAEPKPEKPHSPDDVEKFFMENFGTELFDYTGEQGGQ